MISVTFGGTIEVLDCHKGRRNPYQPDTKVCENLWKTVFEIHSGARDLPKEYECTCVKPSKTHCHKAQLNNITTEYQEINTLK
jgi:hypothetical protein